MKRILTLILVSVLIVALAGCGAKEPGANSGTTSAESQPSQASGDLQKANEIASSSKTLPATYPKETLPLAADAEIIDVRENPASKGLEVMYVSDNDIGTLRDFYEGVLKDAKDLSTDETADGYMILANMDGVGYTIMLSKDAMNPNPKYAGKKSVYIILSGVEGISSGDQMPQGKGEAWPSVELPGLPQLEGHISKILREDGIIRLEITVESAEKVKEYIGELRAAGFSFDTEPNTESQHTEFLAFKGNSMMNFAFKGSENLVFIEYQK